MSEFKIHDASGHAFLSKLSKNAFSLYDKVFDLSVFEYILMNNLLVLINILFLLKKKKKKKVTGSWIEIYKTYHILLWMVKTFLCVLSSGLKYLLSVPVRSSDSDSGFYFVSPLHCDENLTFSERIHK